jgi:hypothetical protein
VREIKQTQYVKSKVQANACPKPGSSESIWAELHFKAQKISALRFEKRMGMKRKQTLFNPLTFDPLPRGERKKRNRIPSVFVG